jgi:hypothetical protein
VFYGKSGGFSIGNARKMGENGRKMSENGLYLIEFGFIYISKKLHFFFFFFPLSQQNFHTTLHHFTSM